MRRLTLVTLLAFGCTTVRQPAAPGGPPGVARQIALAEPQLELWMEGTGPVDPGESARALEQTREALSQALAGRGLESTDPEELLVVQGRAVARTEERKNAQLWSAVGIVVVVVAVVVMAVIASRQRSSPRAGHAARPVGPIRPGPYAPAFVPRPYPPPPPFGINFGLAVAVPLGPVAPAPWVTPTEAWLASRGWFDGDEVELTVELAHPQTGAVSWRRTVRERVDPRDPGAMSRLLDRALSGAGFGDRRSSAPDLDDLPPPPPPPSGAPLPPASPP